MRKLKIGKLARKGISEIVSYVPGKSIEEVQKEIGAKRWIKLASNENLLGSLSKGNRSHPQRTSNYLHVSGWPLFSLKRGACTKVFAT